MADDPSPVIWASDGPRLILADGSVVRPVVEKAPEMADWVELMATVTSGEGTPPWERRSIYGQGADDREVRLSFEPDPEAVENVKGMKDVMDELTGRTPPSNSADLNQLAMERDLAVRQARLAEQSLKVVKMALNDNRPLEALYTANNELDRLEEELEGLDRLGEAR